MRTFLAPLALASTLALGACATSPYGAYGSPYGSQYGGMGGPLESVLIGVLGAGQPGYSNYGYGGGGFQQAAVNACANTAARYGQVSIRDVRQVSSSTLRVYGTVRNGYTSRSWDCDFRSDGRITDFDF